MSTTQISLRYANSLFKLAQKEGNLEDVYSSLFNLGEMFKKISVLSEFVQNPLLSEEERDVILKHTFEGKVHPLVFKFLLFVSSKNRLNFFEAIIDGFDELYLTSKNRMHARIITALNVSDNQKNSILTQLNHKYGREIIPQWELDPAILGGFKILIEWKLYDSSLSSQLEEYKQKVLS